MDNAIVLRSRTARLVSRSPGSTNFVKSTNELLRDTARWRVQVGLNDAAHESVKKSKLRRAEEKKIVLGVLKAPRHLAAKVP